MAVLLRRLVGLGLGFLLLFGGIVLAQPTEKVWQISILGKLRVPQGFVAAEFTDLQQLVKTQTDKLESNVKFPIPSTEELSPERVDLAAYQLTMDDGQAYHLAWFLVIRDREQLDKDLAIYLDKPLNIEQRVSAIMTQDELTRSYDKLQYSDPTGFGVKVLGIDQFDFSLINGKQAYAAGVRMLFNYKDFLFPVYARGWLLNLNNHAAVGLLLCTDSERTFWTPVLNTAFSTLKPIAIKPIKK